MIPEANERLEEWARGAVEGVDVGFGPPTEDGAGEGVSLSLLDLMNVPPARTGRRPPRQVVLRYLVTARSGTPESEHRILEDLFFAALETPDLEIESQPVDPRLWMAFGVAPRPALVLRIPVRREKAEKAAPLVREFLTVDVEPVVALRGTVLGPEDVPVPGVRVELPSLDLATRTDRRGLFQFAGVPARDGPRTLRLEGKGRALVVTAEIGEEPIVIHFPLPEE